MTRRIGISVISLFPFSWGPWGPWFLGWFYKKTNIPFQLVPLLGWTKQSLEKHVPAEAVLSYEGSWNKGETLCAMLKRTFGKDPATALGLLLFGWDSLAEKKTRWFRELYPLAYAVDLGKEGLHDLVEISPNNLSWQTAPALVYDTYHVMEVETPSHELLKKIERKTRLVHFQTRDREELALFISGKPRYPDGRETALRKQLPFLKRLQAHFIVELPPQFLWPKPLERARLVTALVELWLRDGVPPDRRPKSPH